MTELAIPRNMKLYTVGLLFPGPNYDVLSDQKVQENVDLHAAHLRSVKRSTEQGLQIMAVPVMSAGSRLCAMSVYHPEVSPDQARKILQEDPAVQAGRFAFEVQSAMFPALDGIQVEY